MFGVASLEVGLSVVASLVVALLVVTLLVVVCGVKLGSVCFPIMY